MTVDMVGWVTGKQVLNWFVQARDTSDLDNTTTTTTTVLWLSGFCLDYPGELVTRKVKPGR